MTIEALSEYGMQRMTDEEVEAFLSTQNLGVLSLPAGEVPYQIPMSYGYDGGSRLYFIFVGSPESRKRELSDQAETASFLVFSAETMFNWRSALLEGTIHDLPEEKRAELGPGKIPQWRPELFETASEKGGSWLYEFRIDEWSGIAHTGLPPGFAQPSSTDESE